MKHNERIAFRLPKEEREKIEQLIRQGKFKKISQVVREALQKFLSENA